LRDIREGDICEVVNSGGIYPAYKNFAIKAGHSDMVANIEYVKLNWGETLGKTVRVLYIGRHEDESCVTLAIVEVINSPLKMKFIINTTGLKMKELNGSEPTVEMIYFLEEYLLGKKLSQIVPDEYVRESLIEAIFLKNPLDIQYINSTRLTDEHYKRMLCKDGGLLGLIPEARRTMKLCKIAVENEAYAERFVPEKLKLLVNR